MWIVCKYHAFYIRDLYKVHRGYRGMTYHCVYFSIIYKNRICKQPQYPLMEYHSAIKKNGILPFVTVWTLCYMNLSQIKTNTIWSQLYAESKNQPKKNPTSMQTQRTDWLSEAGWWRKENQAKGAKRHKSPYKVSQVTHSMLTVGTILYSCLKVAERTDLKSSQTQEVTCVCSVMSDSLQPHGLQPTRLLCPWGFPGKKEWVAMFSFRASSRPQGSNLRLLRLLH